MSVMWPRVERLDLAVHTFLGVMLLLAVWPSISILHDVHERVLWGFPAPLVVLSPLVAVVAFNRRLNPYVASVDAGITVLAGLALVQDPVRALVGAPAAVPLTTTGAIYIATAFSLAVVGSRLKSRNVTVGTG